MYSVGSEIAAQLQERAFDYMDAPVLRVSAADVPLPFARELELLALPNASKSDCGRQGGIAMSAPITLSVAGILLNWLVEVGDSVQAGDIVAEIEADKATVEIEAPASGLLSAQAAGPGDELVEGATIGMIAAAGETTAPATPDSVPVVSEEKVFHAPAPTVDLPAAGARLPAGVRASPLARKLAAERGIDISRVSGSGIGGRIVRADVEKLPGGWARFYSASRDRPGL